MKHTLIILSTVFLWTTASHAFDSQSLDPVVQKSELQKLRESNAKTASLDIETFNRIAPAIHVPTITDWQINNLSDTLDESIANSMVGMSDGGSCETRLYDDAPGYLDSHQDNVEAPYNNEYLQMEVNCGDKIYVLEKIIQPADFLDWINPRQNNGQILLKLFVIPLQ